MGLLSRDASPGLGTGTGTDFFGTLGIFSKYNSFFFMKKTFGTRGTGIGTGTRISSGPRDRDLDRRLWDAWDWDTIRWDVPGLTLSGTRVPGTQIP